MRAAVPRGARLDGPERLHHVVARGIERGCIFRDDADRLAFVRRLDDLCLAGGATLYAWSLLPNHFHLLVRTGAVPLSTLMQRLLTWYALRFNRRHERTGHLLQNRFTSTLVEEHGYFRELVRYIHLNPLRAGLVCDAHTLASFRWAGHRALLGGPRLRAHDMLRQFEANTCVAREAYRRFVNERIVSGRRVDLTDVRRSIHRPSVTPAVRSERERETDARILGSPAFVERTMRELSALSSPADSPDQVVATTLRLVANWCTLDEALVGSSSHDPRAVTARAIVCFIAIAEHRLPPTAVARSLGISRRSVMRALDRARQLPSPIGKEKGLGT